ncbi:sugar transferase [Streptococcus himalayensis]|nr:sugar transferase [Streptococcus himalayensis]
MTIHITNLYGQSPYSVALMSQNLVSDIGKMLGMKEIGIYYYDSSKENPASLRTRFDGMNAAVAHGDTIVLQTPTWHPTEFERAYLQQLRAGYDINLVLFVHDVPPLMFSGNFYRMPQVIETYNMADVIIVPSEAMLRVLRENGLTVKKVLLQHMWDHTTPLSWQTPQFEKLVNFSGSPERFQFIKEWKYDLPLHVFAAPNAKLEAPASTVIQEEWKFKTELLDKLASNGGFGLVWNQTEDSEYYSLNASYKLSTYLAAGLPVLVPATLSNKEIIENNHLGFVIHSLEEVPEILNKISQEKYDGLVRNVKRFRVLLNEGYFTKKVLIDMVHLLFQNESDQ